MNRKDFFKTSAIALTGILLFPVILKGEVKDNFLTNDEVMKLLNSGTAIVGKNIRLTKDLLLPKNSIINKCYFKIGRGSRFLFNRHYSSITITEGCCFTNNIIDGK
jgi:hypothetical protein